MSDIEWILVKGLKPDPIGAIGFVDGNATFILAFYDYRDANKDGTVSTAERIIGLTPFIRESAAATEVAMAARSNLDVIERDPSFARAAIGMWLDLARALIAEGVYMTYFQGGVKMAGSGLAKVVTRGMVKQIVVRKGFEKVAKKAFDAGAGL